MSRRQVLHDQWDELRAWIAGSGLLDHADEPSSLPGWTVRDLVTHVGRSFLTLPLLGPAGPHADPLSLRSYIAHYRSSAQDIADGTRELSRSFADDVLAGVDRCALLGFRALDALTVDVVRGPRGPITLDDFVATRLIELVVHGDDLERSVLGVPAAPLRDDALGVVSHVLVEAYVEATGVPPEVDDDLDWIRLATGRDPSADDALPLL